ncbi:DUF2986 domain-containing protein [Marinomonas sp. 15G1-11]|uniref:DUF2986 domain-containing protein n=1 Tax=Marinomonas phaeophyticola TaxID=3004091 RepID=A0ABT4JXD7_9GAMM|nr:DUF2986 domain-containing protein [Marinomonas sp. 15G1-11]MCZ2723066.1 DUF2986 domain-containing protein [Marinomonas sp. 15G1-11]
MNRRKKIKQILTKKSKKANEKNLPKNKEKYIAKADRINLDQDLTQENAAEEVVTQK